MDIVVANKKENDQLYYHSCGELCCSGWGATPELRKNNSKIILGTPKNKIIMWSKVSRRPTDTRGNLVRGAECITTVPSFTVSLQYQGSQQMTFFFSFTATFAPFSTLWQQTYQLRNWTMKLPSLHEYFTGTCKVWRCMQAKWLTRPELIPVSVAWSN